MKPEINFVCVGAQKAGTSSLHDILKQHSDICLAANKETHFFDEDENYAKGLDWYYDTFYSHYSGEKICGECTPEYMFFEEVPERIFKAFGADIKIVFILRNPVDRAYSHYMMSKKRRYETMPFEEAIEVENKRITKDYFHKSHYSYLSRGYYSDQIKRYLEYFPKENMFFIRFEEDFVKNRKATIDELCSFLGVPVEDLDVDIRTNVGKVPRYKWIPKFIYKPDAMKKVISFLPSGIKNKIVRRGYDFAMKDNQSTKLSSESKSRVHTRYLNEIKNLEGLVEKDLSAWGS